MNPLRFFAAVLLLLPMPAASVRAAGTVVAAVFDSAARVPVTAASYAATGNTVDFTLNFAPPSGGANAVGTVTITVGPAPDAGGAGVNPPSLTTLPDGRIGIAFQGIPDRRYILQRSPGGLGGWVTLATITADGAGRVSFADDDPPPPAARSTALSCPDNPHFRTLTPPILKSNFLALKAIP